jgi:large subunit ribosomal protein L13
MDAISYKTISISPAMADRKWVIVDAEGMPLGRFASRVASLLRGKHKTNYTPNIDCGDRVIVLNAEKVKLSGKNWQNPRHVTHSGYPGSQKWSTPEKIVARKPTQLVEQAVKDMLPKTKMGSRLYTNLYVYAGTEHPHEAQNPELLTVTL